MGEIRQPVADFCQLLPAGRVGDNRPRAGICETKLQRMLAGKFIRYTYNKAYTVPPNVVSNGPYVLTKWDFKRRLLL